MNEVTKEQIAEWKKEFGKVFCSTVGDVEIYWRKLRRKEYSEITVSDRDFYEKQEDTCRAVNLSLENIDEVLEENAGFAMTLADEVLQYSGFNIKTREV